MIVKSSGSANRFLSNGICMEGFRVTGRKPVRIRTSAAAVAATFISYETFYLLFLLVV